MDTAATECQRRFDGPTETDDLAGLEPEGRRETWESEVSGFFGAAGFSGLGFAGVSGFVGTSGFAGLGGVGACLSERARSGM
ncbi:MAG: hypothetical protein DI525_03775 [Corynebacterium kroppenstedtii]|uniref:Uncharacterized protein n=1 Tax=Corynebacterium kroppenstedtii TaxID=161879 RepID=A0A2W5SSM6_9CORY|nr:MAG: hypothetical protein DI525_03775 [Corynebacterium kroppenstedtii]